MEEKSFPGEESRELEAILPVKLIQHHPEWEIISYFRFMNIDHIIDEIGVEFALGMSTPILLKESRIYSGTVAGLSHFYCSADKSDDHVINLRNYIQYHLVEPMIVLLIRYHAHQPQRWFGTEWLMKYYQQLQNHFLLKR
jgi:hypothetical protein